MNSANFVGFLIQDPELRYIPDGQMPIATSLLEFIQQGKEPTPGHIRVTAFGKVANELKEGFSSNQKVCIEGSLQMNTIDRPEGFSEKRANLVVSRIYKI